MKSSKNIANIALKIIGIIGIILYLLFLIGEGVPLLKATTFADISVYLLFVFFLLGIFFLWRNILVSGIICVLWYAIQWALVFWVWIDGEMTLIFGFPIGVFGIVVLLIWIKQRRSHD